MVRRPYLLWGATGGLGFQRITFDLYEDRRRLLDLWAVKWIVSAADIPAPRRHYAVAWQQGQTKVLRYRGAVSRAYVAYGARPRRASPPHSPSPPMGRSGCCGAPR